MTTFNNLSLLAAGTTICANCTGIMVFPETGIIRELTGDEATGDCYNRKPVRPGTPVLVGNNFDCSNGMFISYQFTNQVESGNLTGYSNLNIQYVSVSDNGCQNWGRYKVYGVKFLETVESASSRRIHSSDGKLYLVRDYQLTQIAGGDYIGKANEILANINIKNVCAATGVVVDPGGDSENGGGGGGGALCTECGGTAKTPFDNGSICVFANGAYSYNRNAVIPSIFGCTYRAASEGDGSVAQFAASNCYSAAIASSLIGAGKCPDAKSLGKFFIRAQTLNIGDTSSKLLIPGKTFAQCGVGQGLYKLMVIFCPNPCCSAQGISKTKSIPAGTQLTIT